MIHSAEYNWHHRNDPALQDERREEAIDARAAEILANDNELTNAAACEPAIERALCEIARICMDRLSWSTAVDGDRMVWGISPTTLLISTTALRAAIHDYARKEVERDEDRRAGV